MPNGTARRLEYYITGRVDEWLAIFCNKPSRNMPNISYSMPKDDHIIYTCHLLEVANISAVTPPRSLETASSSTRMPVIGHG